MFNESSYLGEIRKTKKEVTIFLRNGFQMKGTIIDSDNDTILFEPRYGGHYQMIYKHAISTIQVN